MKVIYLLWLLTSNHTALLGQYSTEQACRAALETIAETTVFTEDQFVCVRVEDIIPGEDT